MAATRPRSARTEIGEHPSAEDLRGLAELAGESGGGCVSLYLASPESAGFAEQKAIATRWRSALDRARRSLVERGDDRSDAILANLEKLGVDAGSTPGGTWTLAAFATPQRARAWTVAERLEDRVEVGERFMLLPLFLAVHRDARYRVLVVSPERVRLFEGRGATLEPLEPPAVPGSLVEALGSRLEKREGLQHHVEGADARKAFHGQGGARAEREVDAQRFRRAVVRGVSDFWKDHGSAPLFVAADRGLLGELVDDLGGKGFVVSGLDGNYDESSPEEIRSELRPHLRRLVDELDEGELRVLDRGARRPVVKDFEAAIQASEEGRVGSVWVATGGIDGVESKDVERLLALVCLQGGEVVVVDETLLPEDAPLVAELRG